MTEEEKFQRLATCLDLAREALGQDWAVTLVAMNPLIPEGQTNALTIGVHSISQLQDILERMSKHTPMRMDYEGGIDPS